MIISASRRTDIPALFGDWFIKRVRQGFCLRANPYNPHQISFTSLRPEEIDAVVFFTKNPNPFLKHLAELDDRGINYYFHFTLNAYPNWIEPGVPPLSTRLETFKTLSRHIGKSRLIWRYDPIVLSAETPVSYHLEMISRTADELAGTTERLYISFMDFYPAVDRRLNQLRPNDTAVFQDWVDPSHSKKIDELCQGIRKIADESHLEVFSCAEVINLLTYGIKHGSCIDGSLISALFGIERSFKKDPHQRGECLCAQSVDIGNYSTCRLGCVYCYANRRQKLIEKNWTRHSEESPLLIGSALEKTAESEPFGLFGGEMDRETKKQR